MKKAAGFASIALVAAFVAGCGTTNNTADNTTGQNTTNTTGSTSSSTVTIAETGSSLLYPLFNGQWIPAYQAANSNVRISSESSGSGAGIAHAIDGTVQIGASDAYMPDAQMTANPTMVNIPLAISAQQVMYNLPGISAKTHLHLTGDVLAQIYMNKIAYWDDAKITALNPGVKLPHHLIIPVHRSDGSGDTFLFTQFLTSTNPAWASGPAYGTSVSWPAVGGELDAKGNSGIVQTLASNPYTISYVGVSWLDQASAQGLGYAALKNKAGNFELPTDGTIQAAANQMANKVPADERISLIYAPGSDSYPIVNFEYAIVNTKQSSSDMASAVKKFLTWAIDPSGGNTATYLKPVHFLPLPTNIKSLSQAQIDKIGG